MKRIIKHIIAFAPAAMLISGCSGEPEWVALYEECKATVTAESEKITQSQGAAGEDAQTKAMRESMNTMAIGMAMTACEMIKTNCEHDPDGPACQAYIEQSRQRN